LFSKIGGKILGNFRVGNTKARRKALNKNTIKTSKTWMNVWKSLAECKGLNDDIVVKYEAKELDECFSRFFAEVRGKSDRSDYTSDSLRVMSAAQTK